PAVLGPAGVELDSLRSKSLALVCLQKDPSSVSMRSVLGGYPQPVSPVSLELEDQLFAWMTCRLLKPEQLLVGQAYGPRIYKVGINECIFRTDMRWN
ncbi:MAG: hypothetical protein Q8N34_00010, partial [Gammaproteobacteria bacterium]|nr:hypothetical protein [Gammaproteobacteria bacterium]